MRPSPPALRSTTAAFQVAAALGPAPIERQDLNQNVRGRGEGYAVPTNVELADLDQ